MPTTLYRVGGVILKKEVVFQHYENRILIRYTLVDGHSATTLRFRPFLAFRSVRQFTHENATASRDYSEVDHGIKTCMYAGYPDLYMQFSKKNEFKFCPDWYRGVEYPKEQERGYASNEDLYVPGYFEMDIKKGETIVFAASTSEIKAGPSDDSGSRMADCGIQVGFTRSDNSECNLYCDLFGVYGVHCCGGVQNEM